jgi:hypothetical protein
MSICVKKSLNLQAIQATNQKSNLKHKEKFLKEPQTATRLHSYSIIPIFASCN